MGPYDGSVAGKCDFTDDIAGHLMIRRQSVLLVAIAVCAIGIAAADSLRVTRPTELTPMTVGAALSSSHASPGQSISVLIGVRLQPGWHTYAQVPANEPYVATKGVLEPGPGLTPLGDWTAPPSVADEQDPHMRLYESGPVPLIFSHEFRVAEKAAREVAVRVSFRFQTCNAEGCLPPTRKVFNLKLTVVPREK